MADRTERVELTTLVMLMDSQGRMLVEDRLDPDYGGICFPGGHVEPGEPFTAAAVREMEEETGLRVLDPRLCGVKQFPIPGGRYIVFCFRAAQFTGTLRSSREGPVFWLSREELPGHRLSDNFMDLLKLFEDSSLSELYWQFENDNWNLFLL